MGGPYEARPGDSARARVASEIVSFALGAPVEAVARGSRGKSEVALSRQVAMYLCNVVFEMSFSRVAWAFGRDRSTVGHACRLIEARRDDLVFDAWIDALEVALRETPAPKPPLFLAAEPQP